jgi:hypothetical protein
MLHGYVSIHAVSQSHDTPDRHDTPLCIYYTIIHDTRMHVHKHAYQLRLNQLIA